MGFTACLGFYADPPACVLTALLAAGRRIASLGPFCLFRQSRPFPGERKNKNKNKSPLYKISKEHAGVPRPGHLMGINYACLRARRRHKALFKINTASGCVRREVGNAELRPSLPPSLPDQRPCWRAGSEACFCNSSAPPINTGCRSLARTVEKKGAREKRNPAGAL